MNKKKLLITTKKPFKGETASVFVLIINADNPLFNEAGELDNDEVFKKLAARVGQNISAKTHNISISDIVHVHNIENLF